MHRIKLKSPSNVINTNAALVDTFLGLIQNASELLYEQERMMNPNAVFRECFDRIRMYFDFGRRPRVQLDGHGC